MKTEILNEVSLYDKHAKQLPYSIVVTVFLFVFNFLLGQLSNTHKGRDTGNV